MKITLGIMLLSQSLCFLLLSQWALAWRSIDNGLEEEILVDIPYHEVTSANNSTLNRRESFRHLTVRLKNFGPDSATENDARSLMSPNEVKILERFWSELFTFAWAGTRVILANTWYGVGFNLAGLACTAAGLTDFFPSEANYVCAAVTFVGVFANVWDGRKTLKSAWNTFRNRGTTQVDEYAMMQWAMYGQAERRKRDLDWVSDWETYLDDIAYNKWDTGKGLTLHDPSQKMALLSLKHMRGATRQSPKVVATAVNNTLISLKTHLWWESHSNSTLPILYGTTPNTIAWPGTSTDKQKRQGRCGYTNEYFVELNQQGEGYWTCEDNTNKQFSMTYATNEWASEDQFDEADSDVGGEYAYSNGLKYLASDVTNSMGNDNWKRSCLDINTGGNRIANGVIHFDYNGQDNVGLGDCA